MSIALVSSSLQMLGFLLMTVGLSSRPTTAVQEYDPATRQVTPLAAVRINRPWLFWPGWFFMAFGLATQLWVILPVFGR